MCSGSENGQAEARSNQTKRQLPLRHSSGKQCKEAPQRNAGCYNAHKRPRTRGPLSPRWRWEFQETRWHGRESPWKHHSGMLHLVATLRACCATHTASSIIVLLNSTATTSGRLRRCTGDLSALHQALPDCWALGDFGHWLRQYVSTSNIPNMTEMMDR